MKNKTKLFSAQATQTHSPTTLAQILFSEARKMLSTFYSIHRTKLPNPPCITQIK